MKNFLALEDCEVVGVFALGRLNIIWVLGKLIVVAQRLEIVCLRKLYI